MCNMCRALGLPNQEPEHQGLGSLAAPGSGDPPRTPIEEPELPKLAEITEEQQQAFFAQSIRAMEAEVLQTYIVMVQNRNAAPEDVQKLRRAVVRRVESLNALRTRFQKGAGTPPSSDDMPQWMKNALYPPEANMN